MENASKALIIAGAILIAILLIGIGVGLISAVSAPSDEANKRITDVAAQSFNAKFDRFVSNKARGSNVKTLIGEVITSNNSETNAGSGHIVTFDNKTTASDLSPLRNKVIDSKTYAITITEYYDDGYIKTITCSPSLSTVPQST